MNHKFIIETQVVEFSKKQMFFFVNHKVAALCWAKLKEKFGLCDVITFDSHADYSGGIISAADLSSSNKLLFGSRFLTHLPHFSLNREFIDWDISSDEENKKLIQKEHKFFFPTNDNFIDVAFMKNIVKNVYMYYLNRIGNTANNECDGINGSIHKFLDRKINKFVDPKDSFILDLDFDFFTKTVESDTN